MFGISKAHLHGRLARRLFAVLVATAVLPVALASALVYVQLHAFADQRREEQLLDAAKSTAMNAMAQLGVASVVLESRAVHEREHALQTNQERTLRGVGSSAVNLFSGIRTLPTAELQSAMQSAGLPVLSSSQQRWLDRGGTVLLWSSGTGEPTTYLLCLDAPGDHATLGRLVLDNVWQVESTVSRASSVAVTDESGQLLHGTGRFHRSSGSGTDGASLLAGASQSRLLRTWDEQDETLQGVSWELFLDAAFAAKPLRVTVVEPATSIAREIGAMQASFPTVLILALVLGLWLATTQIRRYMDPLLKLTEGTRRLAVRRFDEPINIDTGDELAELGSAFNNMAGSIQLQFVALESMAEVDRLLLESPGLEQILDSLLPRMAKVTGCTCTSVLIADPDAPNHARCYDLRTGLSTPSPVRRVALDRSALAGIPTGTRLRPLDYSLYEKLPFLEPMRDASCGAIEILPLVHRDMLLGILCLGYGKASAGVPEKSYGHDFADRLTVALTNFRHEERLYQQANFDIVTGLANRHLLQERLAAALDVDASHKSTGAMLYIDLDEFKRVNDSAGHSAGDELLRIVAERLRSCAREGDTIARLGGDEFVLLSPTACDPDTALVRAERLIERISQGIVVSGNEYFVSASVGIVMLFSDGLSVEELLRNGDIAMYRAKETGRGRAVFFAMDMHDRMRNRTKLEAGIRRALAQSEFEVHYQPIHDHQSLVGAEALIRWRDPSGEMLSPGLFIPVAEEAGLITELGAYTIRAVCQHWAAWQTQGCAPGYIAVNVSPRQLRQSDFVAELLFAMKQVGMPSSAMQVEITESVVAEGPGALAALKALSEAGISIALDDFGTGYSSLSYLRTFPIDVVKVDRSFVIDLPNNAAACRLVETIIGMAHGLQKKVVAEGVETAAQREFLLRLRCDRLQGYLLSKPLSATHFNALLKETAETSARRKAIA